MTIEIFLPIKIVVDENNQPTNRYVNISINDGPIIYRLRVGGLPLAGDLQTILEARETDLLPKAIARGELFDVFELVEKRVIKAQSLVILDEINRLTNALNALNVIAGLPNLALRDENQIRGAIKSKLSQP